MIIDCILLWKKILKAIGMLITNCENFYEKNNFFSLWTSRILFEKFLLMGLGQFFDNISCRWIILALEFIV